MQTTTDLFKSILADPRHLKEHRAIIAGVEYGGTDIAIEAETPQTLLQQPPFVTGTLYPKRVPIVGGCVARQLDIMVRPKGTIPRMVEIRMETRLVLRDPVSGVNTRESEWISKGTFFIDTRDPKNVLGLVALHCYDAMLKAEEPYLQEGDTGEWPRPMPEVAADIAARMGVEIDTRTVLNASYMVDYPNDLTMREILGYIAAAHAGNWIITDAGALRLVGLYNPALVLDYLATENDEEIIVGGVKILV